MVAPLFFLLFLGTTCCEASKHKAGRALCSGKLEVMVLFGMLILVAQLV